MLIERGGASALSDAGIQLAASERDAKAVVMAPAGETVSVRITPAGCQQDACRTVLTTPGGSATPVGRAAKARARSAAPSTAVVIPLAGASVDRVSAVPRAGARSINWVQNHNVLCHGAGCAFWKIESTDKAYYDGNWAWGSRSRRGYAGWNDCHWSTAGYSISDKQCNFKNDPSKSEMYANTSGQVSAFVSGFPISSDRYIHQHVDLNGHTWVVTN